MTRKPRFIQAYKMYERIPMAAQSILPHEGFPTRMVPITDNGEQFPVYCKPKPKPTERWGHRVMVICPCGRHVPFGRMGQHYSITCAEADNEYDVHHPQIEE